MSIAVVLYERARWQAMYDYIRDLDEGMARLFGEKPCGMRFVGFAKPDPNAGPFDVKWELSAPQGGTLG